MIPQYLFCKRGSILKRGLELQENNAMNLFMKYSFHFYTQLILSLVVIQCHIPRVGVSSHSLATKTFNDLTRFWHF